MPVLAVMFLMAVGASATMLWALSWLFDDDIPLPLWHLRQELLTIRTMVRVRRTSLDARRAMLEQARRYWQVRR